MATPKFTGEFRRVHFKNYFSQPDQGLSKATDYLDKLPLDEKLALITPVEKRRDDNFLTSMTTDYLNQLWGKGSDKEQAEFLKAVFKGLSIDEKEALLVYKQENSSLDSRGLEHIARLEKPALLEITLDGFKPDQKLKLLKVPNYYNDNQFSDIIKSSQTYSVEIALRDLSVSQKDELLQIRDTMKTVAQQNNADLHRVIYEGLEEERKFALLYGKDVYDARPIQFVANNNNPDTLTAAFEGLTDEHRFKLLETNLVNVVAQNNHVLLQAALNEVTKEQQFQLFDQRPDIFDKLVEQQNTKLLEVALDGLSEEQRFTLLNKISFQHQQNGKGSAIHTIMQHNDVASFQVAFSGLTEDHKMELLQRKAGLHHHNPEESPLHVLAKHDLETAKDYEQERKNMSSFYGKSKEERQQELDERRDHKPILTVAIKDFAPDKQALLLSQKNGKGETPLALIAKDKKDPQLLETALSGLSLQDKIAANGGMIEKVKKNNTYVRLENTEAGSYRFTRVEPSGTTVTNVDAGDNMKEAKLQDGEAKVTTWTKRAASAETDVSRYDRQ